MGKKTKTKTESETNVASPVIDLKSVIHEHSLFMDKLVELIPARFYLPNDDDEKPWFQGLSKSAKFSAKKETKKNIKQARRDRLDPEKTSTTTLDLLKQSLEKDKEEEEEEKEESDSGEMETKPVVLPGLDGDDEKSVTYEELQERLRRKIAQFESGRGGGGSERARKRAERKERYEKGADERKRKRESESDEKKPIDADEVNKKVEQEVAEASKGLTFSRVKLDDEEGGKKKRRMSKGKELEKAKKLEEMKKDPEKGKSLLWKTATSRAAGVKVHDDPKLLKQSIKKDQKKHQKNAEKWKERVETTNKLKHDKQKKRSDNISAKLDEKKKRKIAKREKKLMRPGFEGRKEGYVNGGA